ncbi:MAG: hypothetical protein GY832_20155 [Chloroflexi bacterium]|nr:hypothetical protein [Chloroflexota bacterium]
MPSAIQLRKQEAVRIVLDNDVEQADIPYHYEVCGGRVKVRIDWEELPGTLLETDCACPDWQRQQGLINDALDHQCSPNNPGIAQVDGLPLCKHVLAVAFFTGALMWPEWAPALTMQLPVDVVVR